MIMQSLAELPIQKLKRAVGIREQIEALTQELNELLGTPAAFMSLNGAGTEKRRSLSAAGRARIAAAQRLRWSKYNSGRSQRTDLVAKKHRLSPEGRAKVAAAVRARWDRFRAAKARALRAAK
jgi:hypothetical protein